MSTALQRSFEDLGTPLREVTFCVVDLETTGGSPGRDAITEVGAVRYRGGECLGSFQTLVDPGREVPPFITVLTGITQTMVTGAPSIEAVLPAFLEFLGSAVVVGHNVRFDLRFLNAAAEELAYDRLADPAVDTAALARRLVRDEVRNLKLATLAAHLRSPHRPDHRALTDARATAWVFHALLERAGTMGVTTLEDLLILPTARGGPHFGKIRLTEDLPRRRGVYLFRDRAGEVLYVGKAADLRSRVRSYFHSDRRRRIDTILRELTSIEHRLCPTDLEARVAELRLIHAHRPRHNRRSRPTRSAHWLRLTDEAFPRLSVVRTLREEAGPHLGPFRGRRGAGAVMEAIWDALPVRRCTGRPGSRDGPCAPAQLGKALCPCDGSLDPTAYREVVERLRTGIEEDPALLLDPLAERMAAHAREERFEEAARLRDRHRALARALRRRRAWGALNRAGLLRAEGPGGERVMVERGKLLATWRAEEGPSLYRALVPPEGPCPEVPPDLLEAEEAGLLWDWLDTPGVRLLETSGPLAVPVRPVPEL